MKIWKVIIAIPGLNCDYYIASPVEPTHEQIQAAWEARGSTAKLVPRGANLPLKDSYPGVGPVEEIKVYSPDAVRDAKAPFPHLYPGENEPISPKLPIFRTGSRVPRTVYKDDTPIFVAVNEQVAHEYATILNAGIQELARIKALYMPGVDSQASLELGEPYRVEGHPSMVAPEKDDPTMRRLLKLPCPVCSGDGYETTGDRHARTDKDVCRRCGGTGSISAEPGSSPEASAPREPKVVTALNAFNVVPLKTTQGDAWTFLLEDGTMHDTVYATSEAANNAVRNYIASAGPFEDERGKTFAGKTGRYSDLPS